MAFPLPFFGQMHYMPHQQRVRPLAFTAEAGRHPGLWRPLNPNMKGLSDVDHC